MDSTYDIDPAAGGNQAIRLAVQGGHLDVVKYLIEGVDSTFGIDPAVGDNCAIQLAAFRGHAEVVKYLLGLDAKYGIDRSLDGIFP